jgi:hypothetical protein
VDSVNVPVPGQVEAVAAEVAADLTAGQGGLAGFDRPGAADFRVRQHRTLVAKRLSDGDPHRVERRAREALSGTPPFEVRVDRVEQFAEPTSGSGPVVYLAVESPGLRRLHARLCDALGTVEGLEAEDYTPHVTVARGGTAEAAERVLGPVDPVEWTVSELQLWDATRKLVAARISLPA